MSAERDWHVSKKRMIHQPKGAGMSVERSWCISRKNWQGAGSQQKAASMSEKGAGMLAERFRMMGGLKQHQPRS